MNFSSAAFVVGIYVRMVLARKLAECLANLIGRGGLLHAERAVIIFGLGCHVERVTYNHTVILANIVIAKR